MRKSSRTASSAAALLVLATPATAGVINPDPLTVSGGTADKVRPAVKSALQASLRNFGYMASPDSGDGITVSVQVHPLEVAAAEDSVAVIARLELTAAGLDAACIPRFAEARYRALAPMKAFSQHRAAVWITVIGLAAVGVDASQAAAQQLLTTQASDAAVNARRERTEFESVSPDKSQKGMTRYAAVKATQLATADLIRQLGKGPCPGSPPVN
jgi:hypothetical protein